MRLAWFYGAGGALLALLTVLMFAVRLPAALSVVVQVLWVALIFVLCLRGARDIRRTKLEGRRHPRDEALSQDAQEQARTIGTERHLSGWDDVVP